MRVVLPEGLDEDEDESTEEDWRKAADGEPDDLDIDQKNSPFHNPAFLDDFEE